jgi:hypothetical protein
MLSGLRLLPIQALSTVLTAQQTDLFDAARLRDLPKLHALAGDNTR